MDVLTVLCAGGWMPGNLSEGWRRLGCTVHEFLYGTHMGKDWSAQGLVANRGVNERLLGIARRLKAEGKLDLIFAVIYDDVLEVETARGLRALGVPMVNYHVDLVGQWYRVLQTGPFFDRLACAQLDHWPALKRSAIRPFYMPMAANPPDASPVPEHFDGVLYMGSPWPYRRQALRALNAAGIPLRVYGHGWDQAETTPRRQATDPSKAQPLRKNIHDMAHYLLPRIREEGPAGLLESLRMRLRRDDQAPARALPPDVVMGTYRQDSFVGLVQGAAINLGFTHFKGVAGTSGERRQVRLRDIEIPMAGGFYLAQDCAQLREILDGGKHVGTWSDQPELLEKCRYYLGHPEERRHMATAAQDHCLKSHTWTQRFRSLLADLGMALPAASP
jgi:hypothetical protein